jgi:hypothetical protein
LSNLFVNFNNFACASSIALQCATFLGSVLDSFLQLATAASAAAIHQFNVVELSSNRVVK